VFRFSLQILSQIFFILRRTERDMIENVNWSTCKVSVILVLFLINLNYFNFFFLNPQISNLMKISQVGAELFHANRRTDGRTHMTKLIVAFHIFANAPPGCC
jgi:hypothetical protein